MRAQVVSVLLLAVVTFASCQNPFSPASVDPSGVKPIVLQAEPDSVMHNFKYAYEHNDIEVYENCLDTSFTFRYTDQNLAGEIEIIEIPREGPSGDLERTRRLFEFFDEIKLETWLPIPYGHEAVGDDTLEVYRVYFQLSVRDIDGDFPGERSLEAFGIAVFKFRQSSSDSLWRIVFWEDQSAI
jgi:hypothetical protein